MFTLILSVELLISSYPIQMIKGIEC